jgi:hypothetical protein
VNGGIAPCILNTGSRWGWVVSFMPQPLYYWRKKPGYQLDKRLGGPYSPLLIPARVCADAVGMRVPCLCRHSNHDSSVAEPVTQSHSRLKCCLILSAVSIGGIMAIWTRRNWINTYRNFLTVARLKKRMYKGHSYRFHNDKCQQPLPLRLCLIHGCWVGCSVIGLTIVLHSRSCFLL